MKIDPAMKYTLFVLFLIVYGAGVFLLTRGYYKTETPPPPGPDGCSSVPDRHLPRHASGHTDLQPADPKSGQQPGFTDAVR